MLYRPRFQSLAALTLPINTAIRAVANIADLAESDWKRVIDVNLTGVFLGMKYQIPEILKTQGAIVNTASIFGMKGVPERSAYAASKAGVISLTMTAASEYAEQGIQSMRLLQVSLRQRQRKLR